MAKEKFAKASKTTLKMEIIKNKDKNDNDADNDAKEAKEEQ